MAMNSAFVFVKPHANVSPKAKAVTKDFLESKGIKITKEGEINGKEIDEKQLIDNHYYAIASKATIMKPKDLNVNAALFKEKFGKEWSAVLKEDQVFNAKDACEKLGLNSTELDTHWAKSKAAGKLVKFGGGFYCGCVDTVEGKDPIYVMNGFFMQMRSKFVEPDCSLYYYVVEWDAENLSWEDFRGKVLGPTDPVTAPEDSLRGQFYKNWESYGLKHQPNVGDNAVHASASPFEALCEKMNWLGVAPEDDEFGKYVKDMIPQKVLDTWKNDPQVTYGLEGSKITKSLFDTVEDTNVDYCLALLQMIACETPDYKKAIQENKKLRKERSEFTPLDKAVDELTDHIAKRLKEKGSLVGA